MANIQVKLRRGTIAEHDTTNGGFTGAEGEVTVDTTNDTLRVHDGTTAGGIRLAKLSEANVQSDWNETDTSSTAFILNKPSITAAPTGTVSAFAGSAAPTGYALCDGSAVNRTAQAALFSVIGTTYGIGDGSTTFNLPDLRGRVVAGLGESLLGATADTLGENNGLIADTKEHLLTAAQSGLPAHSHTQGASGPNLSGPIESLSGGSSGGRYTSTGTVAAQPASSAHNNVQPTIILNYIIKT